ncbi:hypothetical protein NDU88_004091 [Pleurodeles waltl]|uniref:Uncharacterized protein n=1 Tax=Pleurodeles waltl TaxID=8319 RepID=A0AAV7MVG2_PLEWA|nr:hypothetical protein NDU88_004091 [Pleurodeles waltl]
MELWRRIVDRVNAVGQHPRTRDQRTGDGPPPPPPQLTTWEEQVLAILHPEGLAGVAGGMDSGVLKDLVNTRRDNVAQQGAPDTSLDDELPTTSAGASGQEALPQDHDTSTPLPADGEPPRKRSLRSRTKTENNAKTPAKK